MMRTCSVGYHGDGRAQIEIGKDVNSFFSKDKREIILKIGSTRYYTRLPDCFFTNCRHLRTAYDKIDKKEIFSMFFMITITSSAYQPKMQTARPGLICLSKELQA